jgi:hypothetical protein
MTEVASRLGMAVHSADRIRDTEGSNLSIQAREIRNLYGYAFEDPNDLTDPSGLCGNGRKRRPCLP